MLVKKNMAYVGRKISSTVHNLHLIFNFLMKVCIFLEINFENVNNPMINNKLVCV